MVAAHIKEEDNQTGVLEAQPLDVSASLSILSHV